MERYILIVDDDPDAREILSQIVQTVGFAARTASDGLEALDVLHQSEECTPILVLLDLMMPRLDGFGVLTWLRGNPLTRRVPVIVVTAADRDQLSMLKLPGVFSVLGKGELTFRNLTDVIRKATG